MMMMILLLCSIVFITNLFLKKQLNRKKGATPPSPPGLPLIGNLLQIGHHGPRSMCSLSHRYGPLMLIHLGRVPVLVVSSAEMAQEILKTHDLVFANRQRTKLEDKLLYNRRGVSTAPYGEYWRQMKSVCVSHLLSDEMVRSFRDIREEEINLMIGKIFRSSSLELNLSKVLECLTYNVISRVVLGERYGTLSEFKKLNDRVNELWGMSSIGDYVPWLSWIDWICGLDAKLDKTGKDLDYFLERVVKYHEDYADHRRYRTDLIDALLTVKGYKSPSGFEIDRVSIKATALDLFNCGLHTSFTLLEWAMTELLRHPESLKRLQEEVRTICKGKSRVVSEDDIQEMKYLKAVIKEALRLHPPFPLLAPHKSTEDIKLREYNIPAGTVVMVNAWAIGREVATWGPDAEEFKPERHLDTTSVVDFRGQDFQLIPFGAGTRICPAVSFSAVLNEVVLANLVNGFDWKLPQGSTEDKTEVAEIFGYREFPLYAIPSRLWHFHA